MDAIRAALIIIGVIGLLLQGCSVTFGRIQPGWFGAAFIAAALLIQVSVR